MVCEISPGIFLSIFSVMPSERAVYIGFSKNSCISTLKNEQNVTEFCSEFYAVQSEIPIMLYKLDSWELLCVLLLY